MDYSKFIVSNTLIWPIIFHNLSPMEIIYEKFTSGITISCRQILLILTSCKHNQLSFLPYFGGRYWVMFPMAKSMFFPTSNITIMCLNCTVPQQIVFLHSKFWNVPTSEPNICFFALIILYSESFSQLCIKLCEKFPICLQIDEKKCWQYTVRYIQQSAFSWSTTSLSIRLLVFSDLCFSSGSRATSLTGLINSNIHSWALISDPRMHIKVDNHRPASKVPFLWWVDSHPSLFASWDPLYRQWEIHTASAFSWSTTSLSIRLLVFSDLCFSSGSRATSSFFILSTSSLVSRSLIRPLWTRSLAFFNCLQTWSWRGFQALKNTLSQSFGV